MKKWFFFLNVLGLLLVGCSDSSTSSGSGANVGSRPTATPTQTNTPTVTPTQTNTPLPPTETPSPPPVEFVLTPSSTPTEIPPTATPTLVPTPTFATTRYESELLPISFDLPENWVIDDNNEAEGILQIADTSETLFSGSVRRGALITIIAFPEVTDNLTEWATLVTGSFQDSYLADDGATSLFIPTELNGYEALRLEQKGSYTVVDPAEPVTLKIVTMRHQGWIVTIATGTINDGLERGAAEFEWLVNTVAITPPETDTDN